MSRVIAQLELPLRANDGCRAPLSTASQTIDPAVAISGNPPAQRAGVSTAALALFLVVHAICVATAEPAGVAPRNAPSATTPPSRIAQLRIDPNTASETELMLVPGIGPVLARNIVEHRLHVSVGAAFRTPEDLDDVKRIGPALIERFRPFLTFPDVRGDASESIADQLANGMNRRQNAR